MLIFLIINMGTIACAQDLDIRYKERLEYLSGSKKSNSTESVLDYSSIEGSPYYTTEFVSSDLHFSNGHIESGVFVRLNLYANNLEFEKDELILILNELEEVSRIEIEDSKIAFLGTKYGLLKGFYNIKAGTDIQLLSSLKVKFIKSTESTNSYSSDSGPEFKKEKEKHFLRLESGDMLHFKNKKQFYAHFMVTDEALVSYVKEMKLNVAKYDDLVQIVVFMNNEKKETL